MSEAPEPKDPIEALGDRLGAMLPESMQKPQVANVLGGLLGFLSGFALTTTAIRLVFPAKDEGDHK